MSSSAHQKLAILLAVLNAFDAAATVTFVTLGLATEANPAMAWLLRFGPVPFLIGKFLLVIFGLKVLGSYQTRLTFAALILSCCAYSGIVFIHISHLLN